MLRNWQKEFSFFVLADLPSFGGAWSRNWYAYLRRNWENCFRAAQQCKRTYLTRAGARADDSEFGMTAQVHKWAAMEGRLVSVTSSW